MSVAFHLALPTPIVAIVSRRGARDTSRLWDAQDFMSPSAVDEAWITAYYICGAVGASLECGMEEIE